MTHYDNTAQAVRLALEAVNFEQLTAVKTALNEARTAIAQCVEGVQRAARIVKPVDSPITRGAVAVWTNVANELESFARVLEVNNIDGTAMRLYDLDQELQDYANLLG